MSLMMWLVMILMISSILYLVNFLFFWSEKEKSSKDPFECGIDPISEVKTPFYMHFFYISILFLIFDIELAISLPLILSPLSDKMWNLFWLIFMVILFYGLILEVLLGTLSWKE